VTAVVILAVSLVLVWDKTVRRGSLRTAGAAPRAAVIPTVAGVIAQADRIAETVRATGSLQANEEVQLVAEASGRVVSVLFSEGSRVRRGELLVKINDAELQARRQGIAARLRLAEAGEGRRQQLLMVGGVSQEEYDQITNEVNVLRAELELVDALILQTEIRAPFLGAIGLRRVSPGGYVSPQTPVATLRQLDPLKLDFDVPERHANRVVVGAIVRFQTDGSPLWHEARVYAAEPSINPGTRSLLVRALSANPDGLLHPGAFARIELTLAEISDAVLVPSTSLMSIGGRNTVYVVKGDVAEARNVELGLRTADRVHITSGVAVGDTVISRGTQVVRPGGRVRLELP